jgi:hypothetical protein
MDAGVTAAMHSFGAGRCTIIIAVLIYIHGRGVAEKYLSTLLAI